MGAALPPPSGGRLALAAAIALSLGGLGPNLPALGRAAVGARDSDALKHVWSQWWAWHTLWVEGRLPLSTDLLYFPDGGAFFSLDLANALLSAPLRGLLAPVAVYNLLILLHLPAAFLAAWALARERCGRGDVALVAGAVYAFSAWVLSFSLASGVTETLFLWPLPLVLLHAGRTLRQPGLGSPLLGAGLLLLQALACTSHAVLAGIGLLWVLAEWLLERPWAARSADSAVWDRALAGRVLLVLAILLAGLLPLYLGVSQTVAEGIYARPLSIWGSFDPRLLPETQALSLSQLIWPGSGGLRVHEGADRLYISGYLGFIALALALAGARWGGRKACSALLCALLFTLFSFGPSLWLDLGRSSPGWPNPAYLLAWYGLPFFNSTLHGADRFIVGASLMLGLAAASGLAAFARRLPSLPGPAIGLVAAGLVLGETLLLSPSPWPLPQQPAAPSAAARTLAARPGPGAVLDLPYADAETGRFISEILLDQTAHARPVPYRLEGRGDQVVSQPVRDNPFFRGLVEQVEHPPRSPACAGATELMALGFGAVVLHEDRLSPTAAAALSASLTRCLGPGLPVAGATIFGPVAQP